MQYVLNRLRALTLMTTLTAAFAFAMTSCSDSSFQGNIGNDGKDASSVNANGNPGDNDADSNGGDGTGNGNDVDTEKNVTCSIQETKDDAATYEFKSNNEIRAFANSFCKASVPTEWKNQGGLRNDEETKQELCRLKGFQRAVKVVPFSWDSPKNNHVAWWVPATKKFFVKYNASDDNNMIKKLTCQGQLYNKCVPAKETIDCSK